MVYGSKWWHLCSSQQVKKSESSPARSPPGPGSERSESAERDESNSIRLEVVARLGLANGTVPVLLHLGDLPKEPVTPQPKVGFNPQVS